MSRDCQSGETISATAGTWRRRGFLISRSLFGSFLCLSRDGLSRLFGFLAYGLGSLFCFFADCFSSLLCFLTYRFQSVFNCFTCLFRAVLYVLEYALLAERSERC